MASDRIKGLWRRVRHAMLAQGNPDHADPGMDTPERAAEEKQTLIGPPRYPGDNVPPGAWTTGGPV